MENLRQVLPERRPLAIEDKAAAALIASGNGDGALLYLYILRQGGAFEAAAAAQALGWQRTRTEQAFGLLERLGLVGGGAAERLPAQPVEPADELPQYDIEDVRRRSGADGDFSPLVTEVQRLLGRVLSGPDLMVLFGIYEHLALPPEVILLLIKHCEEESRLRYGEGRRLSMRTIEKTAYQWARNELVTLERAEAHLKARAAKREEVSRVKAVLGIRDRQLSPSELRFIESWLDWGYTAETLELAYDRTVLKTGALSWKYMDSIVKSWNAKGLHTAAEIQARDGDTRPGKAPAPAQEADDLALLRKQLGMK